MESWEMFIDFGLIAGMSLLGITIFFLLNAKVDFTRKLLIVFFASTFFFLLYYYGFLHRSRLIGGTAVLLGNGLGFVWGPTLITLLKSFFISKEKLVRPYLKKLIPFFFVVLVINIPYFLSMVFGIFKSYHTFMVKYDPITITIGDLFLLYYLIISKKLYTRIKTIFENNYSSQEINNLKWFNSLINCFIVVVFIDILLTLYELIFPVIPWNIGTIMAFALLVLYIYLGYKGLFQSRILIPEDLLEKIPHGEPEETPGFLIKEERKADSFEPLEKSYPGQLSSFSEEEINNLKEQLIELMEVEKMYLNESLNLSELSEKLGVSNKKLSELLNQYLDTNFYNLINDYRVNEVKKRILSADAEKYNLLSIAYDSGFQSKASFHRIFKQKTGVSPSEFRKKHLHKEIA